jgi:hypothetical protein
MTNSFRIVGLPLAKFTPLFSLSESELEQKGARRLIVDAKPGFPCRVSLEEAELGERVILLPFTHQPTDSPCRASGPIFVREKVKEAALAPGEIPEVVRGGLISVRAYDDQGMMLDSEVCEGGKLQDQIDKFFSNTRVNYLHLHNARASCYSCRVERV